MSVRFTKGGWISVRRRLSCSIRSGRAVCSREFSQYDHILLQCMIRRCEKNVTESFDSSVETDERKSSSRESFVEIVQICNNKTVTTLKSTALVTYPVHFITLNILMKVWRCMIDDRQKLVRFLPVYCNEDEVRKENSGEGDDILIYWFTFSTSMCWKKLWRLQRNQSRQKQRWGSFTKLRK